MTLGKHVDAVTAEQVRVWSAAWQTTYDDLVRAAAEAANAPAGSLGAAHRTARLDASLAALTGQLRALGKRQGVTVSGLVAPAVSIPVQVQHQLAGAAGLVWNLPPERALQNIVQRTSEQVASRYLVLTGDAEEELRRAMVRGIAAGEGPRQAARQLVAATQSRTALSLGTSLESVRAGNAADAIVREVQGAFAGGLARANNLMRTELLDASRMATRDSYLANPGLVGGWRWLATLDSRTCPACWGMHNTVHRPEEQLEGHQSCRCAPVPILAGDDELDPRTGRTLDDLGHPDDAFRKLDREQQLAVLGPKRLEAWEAGTPLRSFASHSDNVGWRPSYKVTPLRDLPEPPPSGRRPTPPPRPPAPERPPEAEQLPYVRDLQALLAQLPADRAQLGMVGRDADQLALQLLEEQPSTRPLRERMVRLRKEAAKSEREAASYERRDAERYAVDVGYLRDDARRFREEADHLQAQLDDTLRHLQDGVASGRYSRPSTVVDQLADGGPGATAEQHLRIVKAAGEVVQRQLAEEAAEQLAANQAAQREATAQLVAHQERHAAMAAERDRLRQQLYEQAKAERRAGTVDNVFSRTDELENSHAELQALRQQLLDSARTRIGLAQEVERLQGMDAQVRRDVLQAVLSRVRAQGRAGTLQLREDSARAAQVARQTGARVLPGPQPWVAEAIRHAEGYYPQEWLDRMTEELHLVGVDRGFHYGDVVALSDDGRTAIAGAPRGDRVALHELGHHAEQKVPGLRMLEWLQQWHRTTDAGLVKSGPNKGHRRRTGANKLDRMAGYEAREKSREDSYPNAYTGKEYGGGPGSSWELFTTSVESLFAGSRYTDPDLEAWALGVLVAL